MRARQAAFAVAGAMLCAASAHAQAIQNVVLRNSFNPVGAGARGLGMGGAFIAVADDGTASSFNPAGLAQLRRTELALVGFGDTLKSTLRTPTETGVDTRSSENRHQAPDFFGLAVPFEVGGRNLTVQGSYQRSVDLFGRGQAVVQNTVTFLDLGIPRPGSADVIADITPDQSGAFHTASLTAGYQVTSRLSLGTSVNYWFANWTARGNSNLRLLTAPRPGARPVEVLRIQTEFDQDQTFRGLSVNAGLLLKYSKLSVGGVVRLPFSGDYGLTETQRSQTFEAGVPGVALGARDVSMTSRLHWPRSAGVGAALRPFKGLTLAGDYSRTHWSRTFIEDVPGGALLTTRETDAQGDEIETFTDRNFFDLLPASVTATTDTDQWRAGGEYLIVTSKVIFPLRGGAFRDRSPVADLGTNKGRRIKGWTAGTGINFSRLVLDVAFERRESSGQVGLRLRRGVAVSQASTATEDVTEDRVVASLIYRFGPDDPLKRALRYLFVGKQDKDEGS